MFGPIVFGHRGHFMCGCPYASDRMHGFLSKEERKEMLSDYIQELQREAKAAEEELGELGK